MPNRSRTTRARKPSGKAREAAADAATVAAADPQLARDERSISPTPHLRVIPGANPIIHESNPANPQLIHLRRAVEVKRAEDRRREHARRELEEINRLRKKLSGNPISPPHSDYQLSSQNSSTTRAARPQGPSHSHSSPAMPQYLYTFSPTSSSIHPNIEARAEEGSGPIKSFQHTFHTQGIKPSLSALSTRFLGLDEKLVIQIYHEKFDPKDFSKLTDSWLARRKMDAAAGVDDAHTGLRDLLKSFELYTRVVLHFAHPDVVVDLAQAFSDYRLQLLDLVPLYILSSIQDFHHAFVFKQIHSGQDDPAGWRETNHLLQAQVLRKREAQATPRPKTDTVVAASPQSARRIFLSCDAYQANRCFRSNCRYSHVCSRCQGAHALSICDRLATGPNALPALDARVSKPGP